MKPGGGKAKGAEFERAICKHLSLWISQGRRADIFWRSAMSGGRASVTKDKKLSAVSGDICSTDSAGEALTGKFHIELKHYKDIGLVGYLLKGSGPIQGWWDKANREGIRYKKLPLLIVKQNGIDPIVITREQWIADEWGEFYPEPLFKLSNGVDFFRFDELFPAHKEKYSAEVKAAAELVHKRPASHR